jgi:hypothetical protein
MKTYLYEVMSYYGNDENLTRESVLVYADDVFDALAKLKKSYPHAERYLMKTIE